LNEIYGQIDKLEKTKIEMSAYQRKTEKFHAFVFLGAVLLMCEIIFRYLILKSIP
jgi:Ca-activated chloride channel family protein